MPWAGVHSLTLGRAETGAKEYLPFTALLDGSLRTVEATEGPVQLLLPSGEGAEADGMYARALRSVLDRVHWSPRLRKPRISRRSCCGGLKSSADCLWKIESWVLWERPCV